MREQLRLVWTDLQTAFWQLLAIVTRRLAVTVAYGMRLASDIHDGFRSLRRAVIAAVPGVRNRLDARVSAARELAEAAVPSAKAHLAAAKDLVADVKADARATWAQRQAELRAAEQLPPPQRTEGWPWDEEAAEIPAVQQRPVAPASAVPQRAPEFAPSEVDPQAARVSPNDALPPPSEPLPSPGTALPSPGTALPSPGTAFPSPGTAFPPPGNALPSPDAVLPSPGKLRARLATIAAMSRARVAAVGVLFRASVAKLGALFRSSVAKGPAGLVGGSSATMRAFAGRAVAWGAGVRVAVARVLGSGGGVRVTVAKMRVAAQEVWAAAKASLEPRTPAGQRFQTRLGGIWAKTTQVSRVAAEVFLAVAATWIPQIGQWGRQAWLRSRETRAKISVLFGGWQFLRGVKPIAIGAGVVAVVLVIGFGVAHLSQEQIPVAAPADPVPSPTRAAPLALPPPVAIAPDVTQRVLPLSRFNPITGPDRPPLPEDANGPHGSLRTTGTYEVALTLDDGPDPRWTPDVLETLRQYRVKATFCVIGVNVVEFPELVREIAADGHTLCNHSWAHDTSLGNRSYATIVADMQRTNDAIRAAAPRARISYFRHPGGNWTANAVRAARSLGMTSLHWDVDPRDWLRPGARAISSMVTSSAVPGSIVLMHDGGGDRRGSAEALRSILPNLLPRFPLVALPPGVDPPKLYGIHLPVHAGQE